MKDKKLFLLMIAVLSGIIFLGISNYTVISKAAEAPKENEVGEALGYWFAPKTLQEYKGMRIVPVGIRNPDGKKAVWATSPYGAKDMTNILSGYPVETVGGIPFYKVSSWKDTSKAIMFSYKDRDRTIWALFSEVSSLKKRVKFLEKKMTEFMKE